MGKSVEEATPVEIEVTPSPPEAKRQRRCVQSKLCWGRQKGGGGVTAATEGEVEVEGSGNDDSSEGEGTAKRNRKGKSKRRTPQKSPVISKELRVLSMGNKRSLASPGNNSCKKLKNCGDANKSDAMKDLDGPFLYPEKPICSLRSEAKLAAEENMRLSAGKQIHPFFSCRRDAKRLPETQDIKILKGRQWPGYDWDNAASYPPVHIRDSQVDDISLDWSNWNFMQQTLDGCALDNSLAVCEALVEPLRLDTVFLKEMHADQSSNATEKNSATSTSIVVNGQYQKQQSLSYSECHLNSDFSLLSRCSNWVGNLEISDQDGPHKERLLSYYRRSKYLPECSLWTTKYQPENASEVCGNCHSVKQLSEWLKSWHDKGQNCGKNYKFGEHCAVEDNEDSLYEVDSDMEDQEDASNLRNVLLITGPVGSGKSAAVYACAKEQGFKVIEVNASDLRNGANIKHKFGEAMESHGFNRWSSDNSVSLRGKQDLDVLPGIADARGNVKFDNFRIKAPADMQDNRPSECTWIGENRVVNKTLILFEDVDTVFEEDHGFISTVLQLAETAKRPIILTSNSKSPVLPPLLDRMALDFELPSVEELFWHVYMICASEKAQISACLLEQLIRSCLGDIRKIIMLLQFWCQDKNVCIVRSSHTYGPLQFDVDAAHLVMPRVIPWGFRCVLSEKVLDEINRTISTREDNLKLMEIKPIENDGSTKVGKIHRQRKKIKLKRKRRGLDTTEIPTVDMDLDDFSDAPESLARFDKQKAKRRSCVIVSSQSDDGLCADELQPAEIASADANSLLLPDMSAVPSLQTLEFASPLKPPADSKNQSQMDNGVQHLPESSLMVSASHICDTFKVQDVSCVPESSFIAGSEVSKRDTAISMAVSSNNITGFAGFVWSVNASPEVNLSEAKTEVNLSPISNINEVDSVYGNEGLGDSQNGVEELPASGYQFMDECSRADFSIEPVPGTYSDSSPGICSVKETWQRLRNQREELKSFLCKNQRESSIVNLAFGLTDLISETDIIFSGCNPLISDVLEPSLTPSVEPDDFSWYDEQYEMGSTYAQHGLCLYIKKCVETCPDLGSIETGTVVQEMLASSSNAMALGTLLSLERTNLQNTSNGDLHIKETRHDTSMRRKSKHALLDALLPIVPPRLSMTLRGSGFHDYLSFMSCISKFESARISESMKENRPRRSRALRHYLSSGSLSMSPDDVELLARSSCFKGTAP